MERLNNGQHVLEQSVVPTYYNYYGRTLPLGDRATSTDTTSPLAVWGKGRISAAACSSDGQTLVVAATLGLYVYELATLVEQQHLPGLQAVEQVALLDNLLICVSHSGIALRQLEPGTALYETPSQLRGGTALAFSPDAECVAIDGGAAMEIYWVRTGQQRASLPVYSAGARATIAFNADNTLVAIAIDDSLQLWHVDHQQLVATLHSSSGPIIAIVFVPGQQLLIAASERCICCWALHTDAPARVMAEGLMGVQQLAITPDGNLLAVADAYGIGIWQLGTGRLQRRLSEVSERLLNLAFVATGTLIMAVSSEAVHLWRVQQATSADVLSDHWSAVADLAFTPTSDGLAAIVGKGILWKLAQNKQQWVVPLQFQARSVGGLAFAPDKQRVALATDTQIVVLNARDGSVYYQLPVGLAQTSGIRFSSDSSRLVAVAEDGIYVWRAHDGHQLQHITSFANSTHDVALAQNAGVLATVDGSVVTIYTIATGTAKQVAIDLPINSVALTADGTALAVATDDSVYVWDTINWQPRYTLPTCAQHVIFSPYSDLIASIWNDTIYLWRLRTGEHLDCLKGHSDTVSNIAFSPNGRLFASGSRDGTVRLWRAPTCADEPSSGAVFPHHTKQSPT